MSDKKEIYYRALQSFKDGKLSKEDLYDVMIEMPQEINESKIKDLKKELKEYRERYEHLIGLIDDLKEKHSIFNSVWDK